MNNSSSKAPSHSNRMCFSTAGTNKFKPQILMLQNPRNSSTNDTAASVLAEVEVDSLDDTSALDACNLQQVSVLPGKSSAPSIFSWPGGHISSEQLLSTGLIAPTSGTCLRQVLVDAAPWAWKMLARDRWGSRCDLLTACYLGASDLVRPAGLSLALWTSKELATGLAAFLICPAGSVGYL